MKKLLTTAALLLAVTAGPVLAQQPDAKAQAAIQAAAMAAAKSALTPEEQKRLEDAQKKAMEDPAVAAAKKKMDSLQAALFADALKADPTLAPLVEKVEKNKDNPAALQSLTPEELAKLQALFVGKQEFFQASMELMGLVQAAMVKMDPTVPALLQKVTAAAQEAAMKEARKYLPQAPAPAQ